MNNLIRRQAVIDILQDRYKLYSWDDGGAQKAEIGAIIREIYDMPSAQPETHEERTETHACDLISRKAAIDSICRTVCDNPEFCESPCDEIKVLETMPSAQPEIIRCGQCKYAEVADKEDAQDGYTCQFHRGSIWFGGSYCSWAERRTDERSVP